MPLSTSELLYCLKVTRPAGRAGSTFCPPTQIFVRLGRKDGHYFEHCFNVKLHFFCWREDRFSTKKMSRNKELISDVLRAETALPPKLLVRPYHFCISSGVSDHITEQLWLIFSPHPRANMGLFLWTQECKIWMGLMEPIPTYKTATSCFSARVCLPKTYAILQ